MGASHRRHLHNGHPPGAIPGEARLLLDLPFSEPELVSLREAVSAHASSAGLPASRTQELVVVAHELATNVVRHGGGQGHLRLFTTDTTLYCQVTDNGPGLPGLPPEDRQRPEPGASSGRGLWLVQRFADTFTVHKDQSAGTGMNVIVSIQLPETG